jgi:site-specific DNA-methyltransferase (adenine-specific)/adenine-specific DNA-methyltransferase
MNGGNRSGIAFGEVDPLGYVHPDQFTQHHTFGNVRERKFGDIWTDVFPINSQAIEAIGYPTQKPEALLERIIKASSNPGDLVFDCFMGSGTTQAVAMKLGRKFIGADINLGAIQTTTKRLLGVAAEIGKQLPNQDEPKYTGFTVYNVNNYDVFRNPVEAKDLLVQALELQPLPGGSMYDGEKDEWFYKIMSVNRLATKADLNEIVTGFDYKAAEKAALDNPGKPVLKLRLVCMGHEPDLAASLEKQFGEFKVEVEVIDILRDKSQLVFKRDSEAKIVKDGGKVKIKEFYPMNLLKKLSIQKSKVGDWKELVDSVMIDFNFDGAVFTPTVVDVPQDGEFVKGEYEIPADAGTIRVKITDLLSESLEMEVE